MDGAAEISTEQINQCLSGQSPLSFPLKDIGVRVCTVTSQAVNAHNSGKPCEFMQREITADVPGPAGYDGKRIPPGHYYLCLRSEGQGGQCAGCNNSSSIGLEADSPRY